MTLTRNGFAAPAPSGLTMASAVILTARIVGGFSPPQPAANQARLLAPDQMSIRRRITTGHPAASPAARRPGRRGADTPPGRLRRRHPESVADPFRRSRRTVAGKAPKAAPAVHLESRSPERRRCQADARALPAGTGPAA